MAREFGLSARFSRCAAQVGAVGRPAALCREEFPKRLFDVVANDVIVGDVEVIEYCLIQRASYVVAGGDVKRPNIGKKLEERLDVCFPRVEVCGGSIQLFSDVLTFTTKIAESLADALARKRSVGSEVEQVVFLRPKNDEPVFELCSSQMLGVGFVAHGALKIVAYDLYELGAEFDLFVMLLDCGFDIVDVGEWCVTRAVLGTSAE